LKKRGEVVALYLLQALAVLGTVKTWPAVEGLQSTELYSLIVIGLWERAETFPAATTLKSFSGPAEREQNFEVVILVVLEILNSGSNC